MPAGSPPAFLLRGLADGARDLGAAAAAAAVVADDGFEVEVADVPMPNVATRDGGGEADRRWAL